MNNQCKYQLRFTNNNLQSNALRVESAWNVEEFRCGTRLKPDRIGGHPLDYEPCSSNCKYTGLCKKGEAMYQNKVLTTLDADIPFLKEQLHRKQIMSNNADTKALKQLIHDKEHQQNKHYWTAKNIIPNLVN